MKRMMMLLTLFAVCVNMAFAIDVDINKVHRDYYTQPTHLVKMNTWVSMYEPVLTCDKRTYYMFAETKLIEDGRWCFKRNLHGA